MYHVQETESFLPTHPAKYYKLSGKTKFLTFYLLKYSVWFKLYLSEKRLGY